MKNNGLNALDSNNLFITDNNYKPEFITTTRVGIKVGMDKLWRFLVQ